MRILDVCKDCESRHLACHDHCQKYIKARKEWDDRREAIKSAKNKALAFDMFKMDAYEKMKRARGLK